ncbi:hypothetical protein F7734_49540 [Scytonema sp. UIC 10036]|uniref:hypothetical protein n=1 Tax=Scytonema sp. UIC 10036 TaxID=2304196 RepID=UPI0012DA3742|nr:hypothetical protein [Scytonema sp. UIC 10036]MUG99896.1 hypothetical protein [Scytonema sp. UIC 10036]
MTSFLSKSEIFVNQFLNSLHPDVADTFTEAQLEAIKRAFDSRTGNKDTLDLDFSNLISKRELHSDTLVPQKDEVYGSEAVAPVNSLVVDTSTKKSQNLARILVSSALIFLAVTSSFSMLVMIKRRMNINLFPDFDFPDEIVENTLCPSRKSSF